MTTSVDPSEERGVVGAIGRHAVIGPFALGLVTGLTASGYVIGGAVAGYLVGRSRAGKTGALVGSIGTLLGSTVVIAGLISSMVNSGCPSCIDAVIFGWMVPFFFLVPFLIGWAVGARRRRKDPSASASSPS